jgi:hypothetical protein
VSKGKGGDYLETSSIKIVEGDFPLRRITTNDIDPHPFLPPARGKEAAAI